MNKFFTLSIFLIFLYPDLYGKIITVDNRSGAQANFNNLATAISQATTGDTLHIIPSGNSYGNIILNKKLVLMGSGHYGPSAEFPGATIGAITLNNGSSGSVFKGLRIQHLLTGTWQVVHNILTEHNYFYGSGTLISGAFGDSSESDEWIIRSNVLNQAAGCGGCNLIEVNRASTGRSNDNWLIINNVLIYSSINGGLFANLNETTIVAHNTIIFQSTSQSSSDPLFDERSGKTSANAIFRNNVVVINKATATIGNCNACVFSNNITFKPGGSVTALPGSGNLNNVNPQFVNVPKYEWDYDYDFSLANASPGKKAATDGTDIGAFGGLFRFRKNGNILGLPIIESFTVDNQVINKGTPININLKAKVQE